jgi:hypothetical protein
MDLDVGKEFGASEEPSGQRLTLYVPNKDRDGALIPDHAIWCIEAQEILTEIGAGATSFPPVDGTWRKPDGSDLWEQTKIVYTYVDPDRMAKNVTRLREFLHRFGRQTNQGKVVFEFGGLFWSITVYEPHVEK